MDADLKDECMRYVRVPRLRMGSTAKTVRAGSGSDSSRDEQASMSSSQSETSGPTPRVTDHDIHNASQKKDEDEDEDEWHISHETLITLYTSLRQGLTLKNWVLENLHLLSGIDVRRFITFGIIKGFVYRVHRYAIAVASALPPAPPTSLQTSAAPSVANVHESDTTTIRRNTVNQVLQPIVHTQTQQPSFSLHRPSMASTSTVNPQVTNSQHLHPAKTDTVDGLVSDRERESGLPMLKFLDGMHCFDEICSDLGLPEKVIEAKVKGMGDGLGVVIHR